MLSLPGSGNAYIRSSQICRSIPTILLYITDAKKSGNTKCLTTSIFFLRSKKMSQILRAPNVYSDLKFLSDPDQNQQRTAKKTDGVPFTLVQRDTPQEKNEVSSAYIDEWHVSFHDGCLANFRCRYIACAEMLHKSISPISVGNHRGKV